MESNNILIVESYNDKYFVEGIRKHLNNIELTIDTPVCSIDDYECLGGISEKKLTNKLQELKIRIEKEGTNRVGILLDADDCVDGKIKLINAALSEIGSSVKIVKPNKWHTCNFLDVEISCHILNIRGKGELETILKKIKTKNSTYADCLESWRKCLQENGISINNKQFDKFWVSIYQRYDCCTAREQKQAGKKCNNEAGMYKGIWDFSHSSLKAFREFIQMFK